MSALIERTSWHARLVGTISQRRLLIEIVAEAAIAVLFVTVAVNHGVPVLRHDWSFPATSGGLQSYLSDGLSTWHAGGIGLPSPYPTQYLLVTVELLISFLLPPVGVLAVIFSGISLVAIVGVRRAFSDLAPLFRVSALAFLLFNSWTYNELVAGHVDMLLAYVACLLVARETLRKQPDNVAMTIALALTLQQLQFFVLALGVCTITALRTRRWLPVICGFLLSLPAWIGMAVYAGTLASIPYTLPWQRSESLDLHDAILLQGYFAGYASITGLLGKISAGIIATVAALGAVINRKDARTLLVALATAAFMIFSLGINGPAPGLYSWVVIHIKASGLFRELYDVIGFVALGYVLLGSAAARSRPSLIALLGIGAACGILGWLMSPPSTYWVSGASLPSIKLSTRPNTRFVLLPAYQPLKFNARGSGPDPDLFSRRDNFTPLNEYAPAYPVDVALSRYIAAGDKRSLEALSVSEIVDRSWLATDNQSLAIQLETQSFHNEMTPRDGRNSLTPLPELSLMPLPETVVMAQSLGGGNITLADAVRAGLVSSHAAGRILAVSNTTLDAKHHWIDARFRFIVDPSIAQSLGGVYTESNERLPVAARTYILANIRGKITDVDGAVLSRSTRGFEWLRVPSSTNAVVCHGTCTIIEDTERPPSVPIEGPEHHATAVPFHLVLPWLIRGRLPIVSSGVALRYNTTFTGTWIAIEHGRVLRHFRMDGIVNGWLLRPDKAASVTLVELGAAAQQVTEVIAAFLVIIFLLRAGIHTGRSRNSEGNETA